MDQTVLNAIAAVIDTMLKALGRRGGLDDTAFVLMVFPFSTGGDTPLQTITNGVSPEDLADICEKFAASLRANPPTPPGDPAMDRDALNEGKT